MITQLPTLEVTIQDHYFESYELHDGAGSAQGTTPLRVDADGQPVQPPPTATWEYWFQQWLSLLELEMPSDSGFELSLRLTDDTEIRSLNAAYRHKDEPTDVLAFAALEQDYPLPEELSQGEPIYLGDIVISVDTALRQAKERGHPLQTELAWLATHGLLHLVGWDHPDAEALSRMLQKQEELLSRVSLTSNLGFKD